MMKNNSIKTLLIILGSFILGIFLFANDVFSLQVILNSTNHISQYDNMFIAVFYCLAIPVILSGLLDSAFSKSHFRG